MKKLIPQTKNKDDKQVKNKSSFYDSVKMQNFKESARLEGFSVEISNYDYSSSLAAIKKQALIDKYSKHNTSTLHRG